jgi:2'-5' RNA ligase
VGADSLEKSHQALTLRAFFGLPVPEAQRKELEPYLAACAASAPGFRWVPAANLHLTVHFIGTVERAIVEGIADRLAQRPLGGFELRLGGMGTFKRGRLVRVVWLQVSSGVAAARELAEQVEMECVGAGLAAEARPFQPHLTLARARARDGAPLPPLPDPPPLEPWRAGELVLYRSQLGRAGSVYEPLRAIRLS